MNVDPHLGFLNSLPSQREQGNVWSNFYFIYFFDSSVHFWGRNIQSYL